MWSPNHHLEFPVGFRKTVATMIMASRRPESLMYLLHDEIVLFIMNKCWLGITSHRARRLWQCQGSLPWPPGADGQAPGCATHLERAAELLRAQWEAAVRL